MAPIRLYYKPTLSGCKGIFARCLDQMPSVIEREHTNVPRAAKFKSIYAAIRCDKPGRCLCSAMDSSKQMKGQKADRTCMRIDGNAFTLVIAKYVSQLAGDPPQEVPVAFTVGNYVVNAAIDQSVVVAWEPFLRFVKGQALQYSDIPLAKGLRGVNRKVEQFGQRLGRLDRTQKITGIDRVDAFLRKYLGCLFSLLLAEIRQWRRPVPAEAAFGIAGGLAVSDQIKMRCIGHCCQPVTASAFNFSVW